MLVVSEDLGRGWEGLRSWREAGESRRSVKGGLTSILSAVAYGLSFLLL